MSACRPPSGWVEVYKSNHSRSELATHDPAEIRLLLSDWKSAKIGISPSSPPILGRRRLWLWLQVWLWLMDAAKELSSQWQNPADILSLLLLIGGDIVQKAIAQLFGVFVQPLKSSPRIYLTPVAFSFGWVGYAFLSLISVIGDKQLMPSTPDSPSTVINCDTGYRRTNQSWVLGRILRDHELAVEAHPGPEAAKLNDRTLKKAVGLEEDAQLMVSLRIDIFDLKGEGEAEAGPGIDHVWIFGWVTIVAQLGISIAPWVLYGDWAIFLTTASGTLFALLTGSLRQWNLEKWPGRRLNAPDKPVADRRKGNGDAPARPDEAKQVHVDTKTTGAGAIEEGRAGPSWRWTGTAEMRHASPSRDGGGARSPPPGENEKEKAKSKIVCLTRGNGHRHSMVLVCTCTAWDLETLATATSKSLPETPLCLASLTVMWICLLISVSGLKQHGWFLILIGGLGMLQNVYASSAARSPQSLGLGMEPYADRPTIIGSSTPESKFWPEEGEGADSDGEGLRADDPLLSERLSPLQTVGVRGALRELEKILPKAGFALMPEFFPALFKVDHERYRDAREVRFWRWMFKHSRKEDRI